MGSTTTQGRPTARGSAAGRMAFRSGYGVSALIANFRSSIPSPSFPLFTLHWTLHSAQRKTRGRADRYSFLVRLFHPQLHAGSSRRTPTDFSDEAGLVAAVFGLMQTGLKSRLARIETALPPELGLAGRAVLNCRAARAGCNSYRYQRLTQLSRSGVIRPEEAPSVPPLYGACTQSGAEVFSIPCAVCEKSATGTLAFGRF
jgi:hypothetical protein